MEWFITIVLAILVYFGVKKIRKRDSKKHGIDIPGPPQLPILGNAHQIDKPKFHVNLYKWGKTYGKIYQFKLLGKTFINLGSEELIEDASETFFNRPDHIINTINYNGKGVVFGNNKFLVNETKIAMIEVAKMSAVKELCDKELDRLVTKLKADESETTHLNTVVMATVCRHVLIYCLGCDAGEKEQNLTMDYLWELDRLFDGPAAILTAMPWLRFVPGKLKRIFNDCKLKKTKMVESLVSKSQDSIVSGIGLIQFLIARKEFLDKRGEERSLDFDNIYAIVVDATAGSILPMSAVITSTLLCIMANDRIQENIHKELDQICPNKSPNDTDRDRLPYLTATMLESFRYISVLTATVPHTASEDTKFHGYFVEKGSVLMNNLCNLHHDDDIWGDSWTFRPERFLGEDGKLVPRDNPYRKSVKLFGTGPRYCKGNLFVVPLIFKTIATIMFYFKLLPPIDSELPEADPRTFRCGSVLQIPDVHCRFEHRL